jgi:hypothetical protein
MPYKSKLFTFLTIYFTALSVWWVKFNFFSSFVGEGAWYNIFYGFMALVGAIYGFKTYKAWGGLKTLIGKVLFLFSLGLLSEWIANIIWAYFNIVLKVEVPYPSIADMFFFAIIPIYFVAIFLLGKASGVNITVKKIRGVFVAIIIPLLMLILAYSLFFKEGIEFLDPFKAFFDISYPLGYSITFSATMIVYLLTKKQLGGVMKKVVLSVLVAYLMQFVADYTFLYMALQGTYVNGGMTDFLYSIALFAMPVALINFNKVLYSFKSELNHNQVITETNTNSIENQASLKIYSEIINKIIIDQEKIIGPLAIEYAKSVGGLSVSGTVNQLEINLTGNGSKILKDLVEAYKDIFGNASVSVVKESIAKVLNNKPEYKGVLGQL